jgi:glycosyltransferase involved in cell wall biosynthesis
MEAVDGSQQVLRERLILHVGRMAVRERYKGQDVLLQAMPGLLQDHPDTQLVLAGRGDDRERLLAMARDLPAEAQRRIFMPGYVEDEILGQLYQACNLFAMPSHGEGFGLVYLEAMSRGKPCLGARVDAAPYVIRDGITGLLVENPLSVEQVTRGLHYLLSDPERGLRLGQAGYDLVQSHYLFEHFCERFYKALLA